MNEPTPVADEVTAMRRLVAVMSKLDPAAQDRVLYDRYQALTPPPREVAE